MAKYRAGLIGLGWMGMLYDLAERTGVWDVDDIDRPTPELNIHRRFLYHENPGTEGLPSSYAEALTDRPEVDADRRGGQGCETVACLQGTIRRSRPL